MGRISERTIEEVKARARILDVFENVDLKRMGQEYLTLCPWHNDQRPSLSINPSKNFAYCHVCQHSVDPLGWLVDRGATFVEAIEQLAARYGIPILLDNPADNEKFEAERRERAALYQQREKQQLEYAENLLRNKDACLYLKNRGISKVTAKTWGLGLSGHRLMIPLKDPQGRTIAFTGRALDDQKPKYKNSPNDCLFEKSKLVFGLDQAIGSIRRSHEAVIVEGQFDVIKLHQEGISNVVGVSGTAISREQVEALMRRAGARIVTICFDGDQAGAQAAMKALEKLLDLAISEAITLRILALEVGRDPDSICREEGAEVITELLKSAPSWIEWWLTGQLARVDLNSAESIALAEQGVKRILRVLPLGPRRTYVQRKSAEVLGSAPTAPIAPAIRDPAIRDARRWAERRAIRAYLLIPGSRADLANFSPRVELFRGAWGMIQLAIAKVRPELVLWTFGLLIQALPEDDFQELRSLINPVPDVVNWLRTYPKYEIETAIQGLAATNAIEPGDQERLED
jgi:DNA primase